MCKRGSHLLQYIIIGVYTAPDHRGKGIATALLRKLIDEAKGRGVYLIRLSASDLGKPVYKQFEFAEDGKYMKLDLLYK